LANPDWLKYAPKRISELCLRSAYLNQGNALASLGREEEARAAYEKVLPMLEKEARCGRLDWERCSILVNIGNTYSRMGDFDQANQYFDKAQKLGQDHIDHPEGSKIAGLGIVMEARRARAFALKKAKREEEGKKELRTVLELQMRLNNENEQKRKEAKAAAASVTAEAKANGGTEPELVDSET
jgi:tetratricopeptide (TPR) repeat protein